MKKTYAATFFSVLWLAGCGEAPPNGSLAPPSPAVRVRVEPAAAQVSRELYEATGTVPARASPVISSRLTAYVGGVAVEVGGRVREEQTLGALDHRHLGASMRRALAAREEIRNA